MFKIKVATNLASTTRCELLTKGQIGAQVQFTFNDHWTNMKKIAVFKRCGKTIDVMDSEWAGDIVTVPSEMTEEAGLQVYVGVYGVSEDGKRITPTLYAPLGAVALGADPNGDPSTDPTLPVWAQIQAQIGDLSNLSTEDKTSLVAAINEAAKSGGGKDGTGIESITYKGEDESGGNMYTVLLTDGTSYDITAPKGAKGDKGDAGEDGAPGKAATIQVGEVTTGAAGTPASVSNVGTDEAAIFDFTIPRGDKGADGTDGLTPHIGDNGNWYLGDTDTGKPSRGEAGAGMDITGATVGQIAKIAAVDASGVPTAWSPVDMPTGGNGDTWELINEVTLGEDAMAVVFDKDKSGAAFALRKFAVFGNTKGSNASNTGGGSICINVTNNADDKYSIVPPISHGALKGDQIRYWHAAAENLAEKGWRWYITGADNTWKTNQITIGTTLIGVSQTIPKVATYLALFSRTSGSAFAAGSKIELYGVRT